MMTHARMREEILSFYDGYTRSFQAAYERFIASPEAGPDASDALPYYHAPCLFITPLGVALYPTSEALARHFAGVMLDMQSKRYQRTGLGHPHLTPLGAHSALLSLEIARFDLDERQYDEYGVTYTLARSDQGWQIAVVNTHPKEAVIRTPDA
ncbi:MAG: hypothetical protein JRG86_05420 [Deltaproteobacteria bacterium]|jgi:hypothetical protein|nr:hypothetical protein [Deltaproteobacteria bacterium]